MSATKDTLNINLEKSAQALGNILLEATLGIDTTETIDDLYEQVDIMALKTAVEGTNLTFEALSENIQHPEHERTQELKEASAIYFEARKTFRGMYKPYERIMSTLSTKRNSIYFAREETEQNAWRMAYFIKEMRMSELQKKYSEPIDNEQMLLDNLTADDMQSINQSYAHIALGLATIYAWQDFIKFLADYFENNKLIEAIKTDAPSEAPIKALKAEAGRTKEFITEYAFEWQEDEQKDRVIAGSLDSVDEAIEYYMPLIMFGSLLDLKRTNEKSYKKIADAYINYTVDEIDENTDKIINDFRESIMQENKGAK